MKVLFCHDGPIRKDNNNDYYGSAHNDDMFKRYYTIAEQITVLMRQKKITSKEAENSFSKITISPINFVEVPNINSLNTSNNKKAKLIIKNEVKNADYIVARLPSTIGSLAIKYAKKEKKPYLIELVGCPWDAFRYHSFIGKMIAPIMYLKTKNHLKKAPYVVYVTKEFLQNRYPTSGLSVNCSNVALTNVEESTVVRRIHKIKNKKNNEKIIIGTIGAIDIKYKGQEYVIRAIGKLKKDGITNIEYHLVGNGDNKYLANIAKKNNVEDQVKFLSSMPHNKIFEWLDKIDIYAQPSKTEGLPRALIEAMSRGLPSFGAEVGGIPELIDSKWLFEHHSNSIEEIIKIILKFNTEEMIKQAKVNFNESKKYDKNIIGERRKIFFRKFKSNYSSLNISNEDTVRQ